MTDYTSAAAAVVLVLVGIGVLLLLVSTASGATYAEYLSDSQDWCDNHDGDLYNARAFFHGGLHCDLPNGTHVHMGDVVEVTDD